MAKILVIYSSIKSDTPRGSISDQATELFVEKYLELNPQDTIVKLDLNKEVAFETPLTSKNFSTFWNDAESYIEQLRSVDKVIVSSPMTNFNYTAVLKNYLDKILVAKKTFQYKYDNGKGGSEGLLKHLSVQIINTQGAPKSWYPWGNHSENLTGTWEFVGAKVHPYILIDGTNTPEKISLPIEEVIKPFEDQIFEAAKNF